MHGEEIRQPTQKQRQDIDKNPPTRRQMGQSDFRAEHMLTLAKNRELSQGDIDLLGEIGDIKRERVEWAPKEVYQYKLLGQRCELGHDFQGNARLLVNGFPVSKGHEAEKMYKNVSSYQSILYVQTAVPAAPRLQDEELKEVAEKVKAHMLAKMSIK